jgi:Cytochrome P450
MDTAEEKSAHQSTGSRGDHGMSDATTGETQAGLNVLGFEIRVLLQNLLESHTRRQKLQHVGYANPHAANARATPTLSWIHGNPIHELGHGHPLTQVASPAERQRVFPSSRMVQTGTRAGSAEFVKSDNSVLRPPFRSAHAVSRRPRARRRTICSETSCAPAEDNEALARDEVVSILLQILTAGNESTTSLIGSALMLLLENPHIEERIRADRALLEPFIEETLRLESPFHGHFRFVRRDTEVAEEPLPKGSRVMLLWGAANRDGDEFSSPDAIDLARSNARAHLGFGFGIHHCLGAALARLEARVVLETLRARAEPARALPHRPAGRARDVTDYKYESRAQSRPADLPAHDACEPSPAQADQVEQPLRPCVKQLPRRLHRSSPDVLFFVASPHAAVGSGSECRPHAAPECEEQWLARSAAKQYRVSVQWQRTQGGQGRRPPNHSPRPCRSVPGIVVSCLLPSFQSCLAPDGRERALRHLISGMTADRHSTWLRGMLVLTVTSFRDDSLPPVGLDQPDHVSNLHAREVPRPRESRESTGRRAGSNRSPRSSTITFIERKRGQPTFPRSRSRKIKWLRAKVAPFFSFTTAPASASITVSARTGEARDAGRARDAARAHESAAARQWEDRARVRITSTSTETRTEVNRKEYLRCARAFPLPHLARRARRQEG